MFLKTVWFGSFLIDNNEVVKYTLFPKDIDELVKRLKDISQGNILDEEHELAQDPIVGQSLTVTDKRLLPLTVQISEDSPQEIIDLEFEPNHEDYGYEISFFHQTMLELAKIKSQESISGDRYIVQAVNSINEITKTTNLLSERLHEWYGMHWPELSRLVKEKKYVELISELGDKKSIASEALDLDENTPSLGAPVALDDKNALMNLASTLNNLYYTKSQLESYIRTRMTEVAPNLSQIVGPIIGAKLIAATGGLERLAKVSSSTVQLLGAEKALFRHLKEGGNPPKHGLIFQHPYIHNAPYWQRGKVARALAGKISIAAKTDLHSGKLIADELEASLKKRIDEIKLKYPNPPLKKDNKTLKKRRAKGKKNAR
jgi:nucleolar protein 56